MLFAAGLGTRLRPLTDHMPKALVPVGGRPLLDITIERLHQAGAEEIVVNTHHFADQIIKHINTHDYDARIIISDESHQLLDTGGGLKKALPLFTAEEPILIHNVDILSNADLASFYNNNLDADITLMVSQRDTQRYLLFDDNMRLVGWTNIATGEVRTPHPNLNIDNCQKYAFSGIHIIHPRITTYMAAWPEAFPIMQFYLQHCHQLNIHGAVQKDLQLLDVGKQDSLKAAEQFLQSL